MNFYDLFIKPYETYTSLQIAVEAVACIFGIISVYLSVKKNIWLYPTGIISTVLYVYILFNFGLLGDCMINIYYTVMSIYGWILWSKNSEDHIHVDVQKATRKDWFYSIILFAVSMILVTVIYYYKPFIDNNFSSDGISFGLYHLDWGNWLDVITTSVFLVGMWLMAKRRLESWYFWILGDVICVPMMLYKELGITSVQYLVFTFMAINGLTAWKKSLKQ
ncbi:nicotinamide mononucleotide transporter [Chryseobacterium sp. Leaf404]|uniref:nicotinamide riboside transporter PnuC n=1 Tax=unclassified Chryseobacterium TaxID=2593645 RepID=UPI0006FA09A2|nr:MULTISPECIES: nicotinamide riboside transporter PnuC [unclassified Chryseobacterium]KQT17982.1 nicotinamide mononucleotide transporter [Chryseobacterium sp. Leaf404]